MYRFNDSILSHQCAQEGTKSRLSQPLRLSSDLEDGISSPGTVATCLPSTRTKSTKVKDDQQREARHVWTIIWLHGLPLSGKRCSNGHIRICARHKNLCSNMQRFTQFDLWQNTMHRAGVPTLRDRMSQVLSLKDPPSHMVIFRGRRRCINRHDQNPVTLTWVR